MVKGLIGVADAAEVPWPMLGFVRIVSFVAAVRDVLTEADQLACAARERYPLAD
jgi:hypothetical protein